MQVHPDENVKRLARVRVRVRVQVRAEQAPRNAHTPWAVCWVRVGGSVTAHGFGACTHAAVRPCPCGSLCGEPMSPVQCPSPG